MKKNGGWREQKFGCLETLGSSLVNVLQVDTWQYVIMQLDVIAF